MMITTCSCHLCSRIGGSSCVNRQEYQWAQSIMDGQSFMFSHGQANAVRGNYAICCVLVHPHFIMTLYYTARFTTSHGRLLTCGLLSWWCGRILIEAYQMSECVLWSFHRVSRGSEFLCSSYLKVCIEVKGLYRYFVKWHQEYTCRSYHMLNFKVMNSAV